MWAAAPDHTDRLAVPGSNPKRNVRNLESATAPRDFLFFFLPDHPLLGAFVLRAALCTCLLSNFASLWMFVRFFLWAGSSQPKFTGNDRFLTLTRETLVDPVLWHWGSLMVMFTTFRSRWSVAGHRTDCLSGSFRVLIPKGSSPKP